MTALILAVGIRIQILQIDLVTVLVLKGVQTTIRAFFQQKLR